MNKKRIKGLIFHIENDDYFGTLATVLDLSRQVLKDLTRERLVANNLESSVEELVYLQANYEIKAKRKKYK